MIEDKSPKHTPIAEIGEFALIETLTKDFDLQQPSTFYGIGDDAAILNPTPDQQTVVSTDLLVEGVHFDLAYVPLKHLGYKAVMVNLSDIYAMNATPTQITVSIGASNRFTLEALEAFYEGVRLACKLYNVDLIGGDTTSSKTGLLISVTALGKVQKEKACLRNGVKSGDLLVVSGDVGAAYLGLQVLEREKEVYKVNPNTQPDLSMYTYLVERQLKPEARKDIITLLEKLEVQPTAMIDISDGLSSEILHLCNQSNVGVTLYEEKIPVDPTVISTAEEFNMNYTTIALNGGEDYELLFSIPLEEYPKIKANPNLTVIGHFVEASQGRHLVTRMNEYIQLKAQGWNTTKTN